MHDFSFAEGRHVHPLAALHLTPANRTATVQGAVVKRTIARKRPEEQHVPLRGFTAGLAARKATIPLICSSLGPFEDRLTSSSTSLR